MGKKQPCIPKMTNLAKCFQEGISLERRSHDEGGDEEIERQKDHTMVNRASSKHHFHFFDLSHTFFYVKLSFKMGLFSSIF